MQMTKMRKTDLMSRLCENRAGHRAAYVRAMEGYRQAAIAALNEMVDKLKGGESPELWVRLPVPEDHTRDYDVVLDMLEMSTDDVIEVSFKDFRSYVRDEWDWTERFHATNSTYVVS